MGIGGKSCVGFDTVVLPSFFLVVPSVKDFHSILWTIRDCLFTLALRISSARYRQLWKTRPHPWNDYRCMRTSQTASAQYLMQPHVQTCSDIHRNLCPLGSTSSKRPRNLNTEVLCHVPGKPRIRTPSASPTNPLTAYQPPQMHFSNLPQPTSPPRFSKVPQATLPAAPAPQDLPSCPYLQIPFLPLTSNLCSCPNNQPQQHNKAQVFLAIARKHQNQLSSPLPNQSSCLRHQTKKILTFWRQWAFQLLLLLRQVGI